MVILASLDLNIPLKETAEILSDLLSFEKIWQRPQLSILSGESASFVSQESISIASKAMDVGKMK